MRARSTSTQGVAAASSRAWSVWHETPWARMAPLCLARSKASSRAGALGRPRGALLVVKQNDVDHVHTELPAEPVEIGLDAFGSLRRRLGEHGDVLAADLADGCGHLGMSAVAVGSLEQRDALAERVHEQVRQAGGAEASLVGRAAAAVSSTAHRESRNLDARAAEDHAIGRVLAKGSPVGGRAASGCTRTRSAAARGEGTAKQGAHAMNDLPSRRQHSRTGAVGAFVAHGDSFCAVRDATRL
jgi:hypothetical protein